MKFDTPATTNPIDQLKVIGKPTDRIDGPMKTTGTAPYAYDRHDVVAHQAYGYVVGSAIAKGRIGSIDLSAAKAAPGVLAIVTAENAGKLGKGTYNIAKLLGGSDIEHYHQAIAVVVGPDAESQPWVSKLAGELEIAFAVAQKTRRGDRSVEVALPDSTIVAGRPVLLVDDIVSLIACARSLLAAGARSVDAVITHALFPADATTEFVRAGIRSVRSTTSVPHPTNAIPLDGLLADALRIELATARAAEKAS